MNKDPESWARVSVVSVCGGSEAQIRNVMRMALEDIAELAAEIGRLRVAVRTELTGESQGLGLYQAPSTPPRSA